MSQREVIAAGGATSADDLHLVLAAATGLFVAAYVATTAVGFGWVFRLYSVVTIATALVFGLLSAQVDKLAAWRAHPLHGLARAHRYRGVAAVDGRRCHGPVANQPEPESDGPRHTRGACRTVDALDARGPNGGTP